VWALAGAIAVEVMVLGWLVIDQLLMVWRGFVA
jgi:hypothetical protein